MPRIRTVAAVTAAAALAAPAAAVRARDGLNPPQAQPGSFSVLTVRVPTERDNKGTNKVVVNLPDGFFFLSYKKVAGWKIVPTKTKLDKPVALGGFSADAQFTKVTMTARPARRHPARSVRGVPALRPHPGRQEGRRPRLPVRPDLLRAASRSAGPARRTPTRPPRASP